MKIIYAGTPEFAIPALQELIQSDHEVMAAYTQPDRPAGRGRGIHASVVKQLATANGIPVFQPVSLRGDEAKAEFKQLDADVMVVAAYGLILPEDILQQPQFGCINIHASLLPRWRGAAPIQRAILAGDRETGITVMQMAKGLDTGDMLLQNHCPIKAEDTSAQLHDRLSKMGATGLMRVLELIEAGQIKPEKQSEKSVTYAEKLTKKEAVIDWTASADSIVRMIHAFNPWPVAQTSLEGLPLRFRAATVMPENGTVKPGTVVREDKKQGILICCGEGMVWIRNLQLAGKKPLAARDFLNGRSLAGKVLGE